MFQIIPLKFCLDVVSRMVHIRPNEDWENFNPYMKSTCNLFLYIVLRNSAKRCHWNREKNPNDYEPMLNIQRQVPACVTDMGWTDLIIYNILYSETIDIYPEIESFTLISDQIWYFKINEFVWMHLLMLRIKWTVK